MPDQANVDQSALRYFEDYSVGDRFRSRGRTITHADIRLYIGATGADHPNHTDEEYCREHPVLQGVCAQGLLVLGITDSFMTQELTHGMAPSMNYGHNKVRYVNPVYVGDTLHAEMEITDCTTRNAQWGLLTLAIQTVNQNGQCVVADEHILIVERRPAGEPGDASATGVATAR